MCIAAGAIAATSTTLIAHGATNSSSSSTNTCNSPIYCEGPLLRTVQLARLFPDSKTFVDMPTKKPVNEVLDAFEAIGGEEASRGAIASFVIQNFAQPGAELVRYHSDVQEYDNSTPEPSWLETVQDPIYRGWLSVLNDAWLNLTFQFDTSKLCDGCVSSTLPVKRPFVIPGGRFREFYYWDTYFVIRGLLLSGLDELAKGMIENLLDFVDTYGFMPNGARIYYLNRSQPPLLTEMIKIYYEKTGDKAFLQKALPVLDKEYNFWLTNTTVQLDKDHVLNRYYVHSTAPRPESYVEDHDAVYLSDKPLNETERTKVYSNLASGAESGWDYSSRWTKTKSIENNDPLSILRHLNAHNIIPIDLNAMLWNMEITLSEWHHAAPQKQQYYQRQAERRLEAMDTYLWNASENAFYDYNMTSQQQNVEFTPAGMVPFWLGSLPARAKAALPRAFDHVIEALQASQGILTTSTYNTTLQWDWPNGWPPLQYITMRAILNADAWIGSDHHTGQFVRLARTLAERNAASAFCSWYKTGGSLPGLLDRVSANTDDNGHMFEKFDVRNMGLAGSGGEYTVQVGFGWTNGVALWIFNTFPDFTAPNCTSTFTYPVAKEEAAGQHPPTSTLAS
ncbi:Six-hairpin glycosidase-like protein [Zychaea mexicana]|uniref:Six-hairpin glycosidase-like protein n=1 Tax=Zychaea mexicana TaxID=64656 RepID=UPI0022FEAD9B|nr:Six-hairpin glycosidase-like protein [Zychaea mexicana]KAI9495598.1 Six-hairpin glycosidase-like protein [Zychaea mexicana]